MKYFLADILDWSKNLYRAGSNMDYSNLHNRWFGYAQSMMAKYCINITGEIEGPEPFGFSDWVLEDFDASEPFEFEDDNPTNVGALLRFIDDAAEDIGYDFSDLKAMVVTYSKHYG